MNDFYVNFARACQDHTFAARIQVGTPRDSQRNETGKCLMGKKTETIFMWILRAPVRITFLQQGSKLGHQGTAKGMKMENVWWVKKHKRLWCEIREHLTGSHFCSKDPSWDPKGQLKEWNWEMSDGGKKQKRLLCEFCARLSGSHFCSKDPRWDPKGQPKEWNWKMSDG